MELQNMHVLDFVELIAEFSAGALVGEYDVAVQVSDGYDVVDGIKKTV